MLKVPKDAEARVIKAADNERVRINHTGGLDCTDDGIEAQAIYRISATDGAAGSEVSVTVTADGDPIGAGTGEVGKRIRVDVVIPVDDPSCVDD